MYDQNQYEKAYISFKSELLQALETLQTIQINYTNYYMNALDNPSWNPNDLLVYINKAVENLQEIVDYFAEED